ncbi:MAG TPA: trigger factor, partial [Ruminococcus sp.]|nr:trigger factor [Ruminococcus sp.]
PGFEEQIVGHKTGEEFSINVKFPEDYQAEELKGKDAEFKIVLHEIKTTELPEVDDEFVKDVTDKDTLDEWKEELKETVAARLADEADKDVDDQIANKLMELLEGEIPEAMFENQANEMVREFDMRLRSQGLDMNTYMQYMGMDPNSLTDMYKDEAEKRVKLRLALETVAVKENIEVSSDDLEEEYKKIAENYKMEVEQVKASIPEESLTEDIKVEKALNLVKDNAIIK